ASLPDTVSRAAKRIRAEAVLQLPIGAKDEPEGCIELLRESVPFTNAERAAARLGAAQAALVIRRFNGPEAQHENGASLELAGDALAVAAEEKETAEHVTRLACRASGATACLLWLRGDGGPPALIASTGLSGPDAALIDAGEAVERAWAARDPVTVETIPGRLPGGA